ncbi:MAG: hypothetical protein WBV91_03905 [Desulfobacterales bacterium]
MLNPPASLIYAEIYIMSGALSIMLADAECGMGNAECLEFRPFNGEAKILQSWQGDYTVIQLNLIPEKQGDQSAGFNQRRQDV